MTAPPQTYGTDHSTALTATLDTVGANFDSPVNFAPVSVVPISLADANGNGMGKAAPPHLLWESLESAFSGSEIETHLLYGSPAPEKKRLAGYIAMPLTLVVSVLLWVGIVELVLTR